MIERLLQQALRIAPVAILYILVALTAAIPPGGMLSMIQAQILFPFVGRRPTPTWEYEPVFVEDCLHPIGFWVEALP